MHLSQLLACALLLTLLSLRPSEAKPGAPPKVGAVVGTPSLGEAWEAGGLENAARRTQERGKAGGCLLQDARGREPGSPRSADSGVHFSSLRRTSAHAQPPTPVWPARRAAKGGQGASGGSGEGGRVAGGCGAKLAGIGGGGSGLGRDTPRRRARGAGASESPVLQPRVPSPARSFLGQVPRTPPGEELAEPQAAGGGQKKGDKAPGGGGANLKGDRSRLLRDLRVDTKSRAAWARLLQEHPNARKYKGANKKGLSKGCFGLKLDRIGSMSGLGC
ncbi:C-type natriuretic peptide isoform X1 [Pan troglodytes]|nr:C-type natriuretic peptide isoform X1 [Pan troglodytes]